MPTIKLLPFGAFALLGSATLLTALHGRTLIPHSSTPPPGQERLDDEGYAQRLRMNQQIEEASPAAPAGVMESALVQRQAMLDSGAQAKAANASQVWKPYGNGPLIFNDAKYTTINGLGLGEASGRVDQFAYDAVNKRLFAANGTGGVWMTADNGDNWLSVGDKLPTQTAGTVAWLPTGGSGNSGGTLVVGSGEANFGGNVYTGMGAFWSSDLGASWDKSTGVPGGIMGFALAADPGTPGRVYFATSKGLYRSDDAGRSFADVRLPVSAECKGKYDEFCAFASYVTDVVVQPPGGSTSEAGGKVLAVVGFRTGNEDKYPDGKARSPGNGLYLSATGAVDSFAALPTAAYGNGATPVGFAPQNRVGRTSFGVARGPQQNHNYVYALVQDAVTLRGGSQVDLFPGDFAAPGRASATHFNGLYVSANFGTSWTRMADDVEISTDNSSTFTTVSQAQGSAAGIQAWYNQWLDVDPTRHMSGVPTRLAFGLEEVWQNRAAGVALNGTNQSGPYDFGVIGTYFGGSSCMLLNSGTPACPGRNPPNAATTTHPDHQAGIYVPQDDGSVCLFAGHDGGVSRQCKAASAEMDNAGWGIGNNRGMNTLIPYGISVAKDGTLWAGLQDNGTVVVDPNREFKVFASLGGDGFSTAVHPDNTAIAYGEVTNAAIRKTTNGGISWTTITPTGITGARFFTPFVMDPTDPNHLVIGGQQIFETTLGSATVSGSWVNVFTLGLGNDGVALRAMTAVDSRDTATYVGYCGLCSQYAKPDPGFAGGIATNVGGALPPKKASADGWHLATASGLPNRFITGLRISPSDPRTVYATVAAYSPAQWIPIGGHLDKSINNLPGSIFMSTDAGENFVNITGNLPTAHARTVMVWNNQLVVGTDLGAYISDSLSGGVWAPLGTGMPTAIIHHLALQPDSPKRLFAGTWGRGMWLYELPGIEPPPPPPVNTAPLAVLDADRQTGPKPLTVNYSAARSSDPDAGDRVASYSFDFGDGSPVVDGPSAVASHTYNTAGTYGATLTVADSKGKISDLPSTLTITVTEVSDPPPGNVPPTARLSASPVSGTAPLTVRLDASGSDAGEASDAVVLYSFDCGNGLGVAQTTARHDCFYTQPGQFTASVSVKDSRGANSATAARQVILVQAPPAEIGRFGGGALGSSALLGLLALAGLRRRRR